MLSKRAVAENKIHNLRKDPSKSMQEYIDEFNDLCKEMDYHRVGSHGTSL